MILCGRPRESGHKVSEDRTQCRQGITFGSWNICRGLNAKLSEIRQIVETKGIDIMFLQEIDILDFSPATLSLPGFSVFVDKGLKKRTCILVRKNIFENITQIYPCSVLPQVWLQVTENSGRKTMLTNIYREWCKDQAKVVEELKNNLSKSLSSGGRIIMAGDFNLNPQRGLDTTYSSHHVTSILLHKLAELGLENYSFGDTFNRTVEGKEISSELDWLVSNCEVWNLQNERFGLSDHSLLTWKSNCSSRSNTTKGVYLRNLSRINKTSFAKDLSMQP